MSPYRSAAERGEESEESKRVTGGCPDLDLLPVLVPFWLISIARVVGAEAHHQRVPLDVNLAWLAVLFVPFLFQDAARYLLRRVGAALQRHPQRRRT